MQLLIAQLKQNRERVIKRKSHLWMKDMEKNAAVTSDNTTEK